LHLPSDNTSLYAQQERQDKGKSEEDGEKGRRVNSSFRLILTGAGLLHANTRGVPGADVAKFGLH